MADDGRGWQPPGTRPAPAPARGLAVRVLTRPPGTNAAALAAGALGLNVIGVVMVAMSGLMFASIIMAVVAPVPLLLGAVAILAGLVLAVRALITARGLGPRLVALAAVLPPAAIVALVLHLQHAASASDARDAASQVQAALATRTLPRSASPEQVLAKLRTSTRRFDDSTFCGYVTPGGVGACLAHAPCPGTRSCASSAAGLQVRSLRVSGARARARLANGRSVRLRRGPRGWELVDEARLTGPHVAQAPVSNVGALGRRFVRRQLDDLVEVGVVLGGFLLVRRLRRRSGMPAPA